MNDSFPNSRRPLALVILDGWGFAPRTESNAIASAHTPYYDDICSRYPMTTLAASGSGIGQPTGHIGSVEVGHLNIGTGRAALTPIARIKDAIEADKFASNPVLVEAFERAAADGAAVHLIGMVSGGEVHASTDCLYALLRMAKKFAVKHVFIHAILDGLDVPARTADIYVEALEIKLADIGVGTIATLCGRFFAMDSRENWERTARAFTMLVHAEGERIQDAVTGIRNSFLRGISDEFISPLIIEDKDGNPVGTIKNGDSVIFFNHRPESMRQLARSICGPEGAGVSKPIVRPVCLTDYDSGLQVPTAFENQPERNTLTEVLTTNLVPNFKITEAARTIHMTHFFDGGMDRRSELDNAIILPSVNVVGEPHPESQSFKITNSFLRFLESSAGGFFAINLPAADMMAETGDTGRTVAAIQYIDTCLGGIYEKMLSAGGSLAITSSHGRCEAMSESEFGAASTANPVPFHLVTPGSADLRLRDGGSLRDIAPTILAELGIEVPAEMTGSDLRCN